MKKTLTNLLVIIWGLIVVIFALLVTLWPLWLFAIALLIYFKL